MRRHPRRLGVEPLEDRTTPTVIANPPPAVLDPAFGTGGIAEIRPVHPVDSGRSSVPELIGLPGGRVLVLGLSDADGPFVARLNPDGTPDPTFGTAGRAPLIEAV